jgi:hypothetical protein
MILAIQFFVGQVILLEFSHFLFFKGQRSKLPVACGESTVVRLVLPVPCGKFIIVTSSHVDMSDHNPKVVYGAYEQVRHRYPPHQANFILQLVIIEV